MKNNYPKILISLSIILSIFSVFYIITPQEVEASPGIHFEFKCTGDDNACGDKIAIRVCDSEGNCTGEFYEIQELLEKIEEKWPGQTPDNENDLPGILQCPGWKTCDRIPPRVKDPKDWGMGPVACVCNANCLDDAKNPRYYDNPNYTDNLEASLDPSNIFLPVKLDWDDVEHAKGYKYRVWNVSSGLFGGDEVSKSEAIPEPCLIKPGKFISDTLGWTGLPHPWKVAPCCTRNGKTLTDKGIEVAYSYFARAKSCKDWSKINTDWQFITNPAPELIPADTSPYPEFSPVSDPDWNGEEIGTGMKAPVILDWCDVKDAKSYRALFHIIQEDGSEVCHPYTINQQGQCLGEIVHEEKRPPPYPSVRQLFSDFPDFKGFFTKNTQYKWEISACGREDGLSCTNFGQKWNFQPGDFPLPEFHLISPPDDPEGEKSVGYDVILRWEHPNGINSYRYEINPGHITGWIPSPEVHFNWIKLPLQSFFTWKVRPCWGYKGEEDKCEDKWSEEWTFLTTGAPPENLTETPLDNLGKVIIPATLHWDDVPGAGSYKYQVASDRSFLNIVSEGITDGSLSEVTVDYPVLKLKKGYWWRVKTCADKEGKVCSGGIFGGLGWSDKKHFKTFDLQSPTGLSPKNGEEIFTYQMPKRFSCNPVTGGKYYRFVIKYTSKSPEETSDECTIGKTIEKIIPDSSTVFSLNCLGEYTWKVQACLDKDCKEAGAGKESLPHKFTLSQATPPPGKEKGLVPCGRDYDDPNTPWNEREQCQIKHLFLLIRNILDFLLWKVATILLILALVATGVMFYISKGETTIILQVKSAFKWIAIGYVLIFLAWSIINFLLALAGFQFQIFGHWWEIKL